MQTYNCQTARIGDVKKKDNRVKICNQAIFSGKKNLITFVERDMFDSLNTLQIHYTNTKYSTIQIIMKTCT